MKRSSTWITSILYRHTTDGRTWLAIFTRNPNRALFYANVPSYIPGLLVAGTGRRSVGLAYNRLVKNQYPYQRIDGRDKVEELRMLMSTSETRKVS